MIEVKINEAEGKVFVTGHAGYAEEGRDIICAGVSALFYGFCEAEATAGGLMEIRSKPGDCYAKYRRTKSARIRMEVLKAGVKMMAITYPDNVMMITGEKTPREFCYDD